MAVATHQNCRIYLDKYDLSGKSNKVQADQGARELDATVFTNTAMNTAVGQWNPKVSGSGFMEFGVGLIDQALRNSLGVASLPVTISPEAGAAGDTALSMVSLEANYTPINGKVGDLLPFTFNAMAQGQPLVSGRIFVPASPVLASGSGTSGIIQLGAVSATQKAYVAVHVLTVTGSTPTLDITVKSAALVGFGSPTTRVTVATQSVAGSAASNVAGAITDQFWRVDYTVGGTSSPTFGAVIFVGIF